MVQNLVKEHLDPTLLVKSMNDNEGDRTAHMDYEVIKAGKFAMPREDPEPNHIATHREQMMSDEFQTLPLEQRQALVTHVQAEMASLQRRADAQQTVVDANEALNTPAMPTPLPGETDLPPAPDPMMGGAPGAMPAPQPVPSPAPVAATPENAAPMMPAQ
jgi:hypothetical protein